MLDSIEIANVTRRLKSDGVTLESDTRVMLFAYLDDQKKVNLLFNVYRGDIVGVYDSCEFDTVLEVSDLPNPSGNRQQWERVRILMEQNDKLSPGDAWLKVAVGNAARKWKFIMEADSESSFYFSITTPKRSTSIEAKVEKGNFFSIG